MLPYGKRKPASTITGAQSKRCFIIHTSFSKWSINADKSKELTFAKLENPSDIEAETSLDSCVRKDRLDLLKNMTDNYSNNNTSAAIDDPSLNTLLQKAQELLKEAQKKGFKPLDFQKSETAATSNALPA